MVRQASSGSTKGPPHRVKPNNATIQANTIQDKRRRLQESLKMKKINKKIAMGLLPTDDSSTRSTSPNKDKPHSSSQENEFNSSSQEFVKSLNPIPRKKKRSKSPVTDPSADTKERNTDDDKEVSRLHIMSVSQLLLTCLFLCAKTKRPRVDEEFKPINPSWLDLDDLPSELFQDHQTYILKQVSFYPILLWFRLV